MAAPTRRRRNHALAALVMAALWPLYLIAPTHAEEPEENDGTTAPPDVPAVERICPDVIPVDPTPDAVPEPWLAALQDFATGRGVTVAVIDTGVAQHPALNVVDGRDVIAERLGESAADITVGPFDDCDRHGTIVAGRIASIAPDVEIISIKQTTAITNNQHQDPGGNLATMIDAISIALDMGVDVINLSVVACAPDEHTAAVVRQQLATVIDRAEAQGVVVVAASGNNSPNCQPGDTIFPGADPRVISVSALDSPRLPAQYALPPHNVEQLIAAQGHVPYGLDPRGEGFIEAFAPAGPRESAKPIIGTSFAAPIITGIVAALKQRHPNASTEEFRQHLFHNSDPATGYISPVHAVTSPLSSTAEEEKTTQAIELSTTHRPRSWESALSPGSTALAALIAGGCLGVSLLAMATASPRRKLHKDNDAVGKT